MHSNYKTLQCYNCKSVILKLPVFEVKKLNGFNFVCECCGHQNHLAQSRFERSDIVDPSLNIYSIENVAAI